MSKAEILNYFTPEFLVSNYYNIYLPFAFDISIHSGGMTSYQALALAFTLQCDILIVCFYSF